MDLKSEFAFAAARVVFQFRAFDAVDLNDNVALVRAQGHSGPLSGLEVALHRLELSLADQRPAIDS